MTRELFDKKLREMQDDVLIMGSMVEKAIQRSMEALRNRDAARRDSGKDNRAEIRIALDNFVRDAAQRAVDGRAIHHRRSARRGRWRVRIRFHRIPSRPRRIALKEKRAEV